MVLTYSHWFYLYHFSSTSRTLSPGSSEVPHLPSPTAYISPVETAAKWLLKEFKVYAVPLVLRAYSTL